MTSFLTANLTQSGFAWALLGSAIAHLCLLYWLPNSIKLSKLPSTPKRISLVKVIALPPNLKPLKSPDSLEIEQEIKQNITEQNLKSDAPEPLAPSLKQSLSVLPLPNQRPFTTLDTDVALPNLAMASPLKEEQNPQPVASKPIDSKSIASESFSKETPSQSAKNSPTKSNLQESNPKGSNQSKPNNPSKPSSPIATKKEIATPIPDPTEPIEKPTKTAFTSTLARIYQQYGAENLVPRLIAPQDALIDPDKREPGIVWIEPAINSSQTGTATIVLIVAPDGTVEQELINENEPTELREIALQTVKGYYQKFLPIEPKWEGKYRLVTIRFDFV